MFGWVKLFSLSIFAVSIPILVARVRVGWVWPIQTSESVGIVLFPPGLLPISKSSAFWIFSKPPLFIFSISMNWLKCWNSFQCSPARWYLNVLLSFYFYAIKMPLFCGRSKSVVLESMEIEMPFFFFLNYYLLEQNLNPFWVLLGTDNIGVRTLENLKSSPRSRSALPLFVHCHQLYLTCQALPILPNRLTSFNMAYFFAFVPVVLNISQNYASWTRSFAICEHLFQEIRSVVLYLLLSNYWYCGFI